MVAFEMHEFTNNNGSAGKWSVDSMRIIVGKVYRTRRV